MTAKDCNMPRTPWVNQPHLLGSSGKPQGSSLHIIAVVPGLCVFGEGGGGRELILGTLGTFP